MPSSTANPFSPVSPVLASEAAPSATPQAAPGLLEALDAHLARAHPREVSCAELGEVALSYTAHALSTALAQRAEIAVGPANCRIVLLEVLGFGGPDGERRLARALAELQARAGLQ